MPLHDAVQPGGVAQAAQERWCDHQMIKNAELKIGDKVSATPGPILVSATARKIQNLSPMFVPPKFLADMQLKVETTR